MKRRSLVASTRRYLYMNLSAYKTAMTFGSKPILPKRRRRKRPVGT
jgi:hypothetical protein